MKKFLPILIIFFVAVIFFRPFIFQNLLPIPSDTIIGLYNPFRDLYAKDYPRGIPFKNFLITDPVRQQYPWRFESILQEKVGKLPLWNPYSLSGTPLLANQQSAPLTPFNFLFFILPFSFSWSLLIFLQPILAALFTYFYLRNLKISTLPSIVGATAFIFSGFFISWLEWGTVDSVALWLPLILLSVDKIFSQKKNFLWYTVLALSLVVAFLAGHLQTFFYIFLVALSYFSMRFFSSKTKTIHLLPSVVVFLSLVLVTCVQWLPLLQLILHSARDTDLTMSAGWFIPWQHLVTFFVPDFFGNPTTLNYWGVWNYAELAGYVGIPALFFAFLGIGKNKNTLFFAGVGLIALLFALPTPLAYIPFSLHIPFLSTAQPTRLLVLIDFSLVILSAFGLNDFMEKKSKKFFIISVLFAMGFAVMWFVVILHAKILPSIPFENISVVKHNLIFPTTIYALLFLLTFMCWLFWRKKNIFFFALCCLVLLQIFDGIRYAEKFTPFTKSQYLFPSTKSLAFLQNQHGLFRIMATDSQILPPNFSVMYHLQSIDGYDPLYSKDYGEFIAAMGRGKADIHTPFGFNRLLTPQQHESRLIDLANVAYVLSLHELKSQKLKKVFTEGQTIVYENTHVFPRAFFVQSITKVQNNQEAANFLFDSTKDIRNAAAVLHYSGKKEKFDEGSVVITVYSADEILLKTHTSSDGFLVLTDSFYPTWHVYVDGVETKIYQTDLAFRGVIVPKGMHDVKFAVHLF